MARRLPCPSRPPPAARLEAREAADHLAVGARADQHPDARRAVVGAGAVLLRAPAELAPDQRQDAIRLAALLEVALEGIERLRRPRRCFRAGFPPGPSACRSRRRPPARRT